MLERLYTLFLRLRGFFTSRARDEELDREVRGHLDLLALEFERGGMAAAEARAAALRRFGGIAHLEDDLHDRRGLPPIETFFRDLRYACASRRRSRRLPSSLWPLASAPIPQSSP